MFACENGEARGAPYFRHEDTGVSGVVQPVHLFGRSAVESGGREDTFRPGHRMKVHSMVSSALVLPQMASGKTSGPLKIVAMPLGATGIW